MAKKRTLLLTIVVILTLLWAADAFIASATSPAVTKKLRAALDAHPGVRVTILRARVHPMFCRLDVDDIHVFDPAAPAVRILYAVHASARPDVGSWFVGRRDIAELSLDGVSLNVVKDWQGRFNIESLMRPNETSGWKYKDWTFNLYERLKRLARGRSVERKETPFTIGCLRLRGRLVLTDRRMKPLVLRDFEARIYGLRKATNGIVEFDALNMRGAFRGARNGRFDAEVTRSPDGLHAVLNLKNFDLAPLLPLYRSTSPVFFDKGFVTLRSDTRLTADKIDSRNHLRIDDYVMRPAVSWSPESSTVLRALNRHHVFDIRFAVTGHPDHPSFEGLVDSLLKTLEKDFDKHTLALIRARAQQEMAKAETNLGR